MAPLAVLEGFDRDRFLAHYWRQAPCLIRHWLRPEALSLDRALALAEEHELPTRRVTGSQAEANWTLQHGPFDRDPRPATETAWTILIQEVDKVEARVERLLTAFRFLPGWMIDDIMISWAADGGSVGAHVDAYDVFLVQAEGQRRWQLAGDFDPRLDERFELALLADWQPQGELLASPGDCLYLPAGIAHHGVAVGPCQTWSIGLRTPSGPEFMMYLAEQLAESRQRSKRLAVAQPDPDRADHLGPAVLADLRGLLQDCLALDDDELAGHAACFLSSWRLWPNDLGRDDLGDVLDTISSTGGLKLATSARLVSFNQGNQQRLCVNGLVVDCPPDLAARLARTRRLDRAWLEHPGAISQLIDAAALE